MNPSRPSTVVQPSPVREESHTQSMKSASWLAVLTLAYQSLGVVYGDLSTSPLYVYKSTFMGKLCLHENDEEVYGVLSFIFWTFTLIPLFKYIFFVLTADDNGEGGTFALYSLLCRHARLCVLPNQQASDEKLSAYGTEGAVDTWQSSMMKVFFEKHPRFRNWLLIIVLLGTCMTISDGVLTPTISVLSAVSGVRVKFTTLHEKYVVVISCVILVGLFSLQHHGTRRVAFLFAPIVTAWLLCISGIGVYNIVQWNPSIFRALSPFYMYRFLQSTRTEGWVSLGGVVLCITGVETMFADLGHFSPFSIKIAFTFLVYPCLMLAYIGEAAFLSKHHQDIQQSFYKAIPEPVFWPVFVVATLASIVGSQAVISATFSIVSQCCALSCFPRVKIVHTSSQIYGQIYIPEVNWILMCLCLAVTIGLRDTNMIGHAYVFVFEMAWKERLVLVGALICLGAERAEKCYIRYRSMMPKYSSHQEVGYIQLHCKFFFPCSFSLLHQLAGLAVTVVMFVTSCLMFLVIIIVWKQRIMVAVAFLVFFGSIELFYISASLTKVHEGGWIPLILSLIFMCIMYVWNYGTLKKHEFDVENRVSIYRIFNSGPSIGMVRVPGIGVIYTDMVTGVPAVFGHFVTNLPAFHQVLVFVCVKSIQVPYVCEQERFLIGRIGPKEYGMFRCIVRYGYKDVQQENYNFENRLVSRITEFVETEGAESTSGLNTRPSSGFLSSDGEENQRCLSDFKEVTSDGLEIVENSNLRDESLEIMRARESGVTYILGNSHAKAKKSASILKKLAINIIYDFLGRNCRGPDVVLNVPPTSLLEVGMIYYV